MPRYDATQCECRIFTRRSGVLGAFGHDLELAPADYFIAVERDDRTGELRITAEFTARSVRVVEAVEHGVRRPGALSTRDKGEIDRNLAEQVLQSDRHPVIAFRSTSVEREDTGYRIAGRLTLRGAERELRFRARRECDRLTAEVTLHQPDFGIAPFKALGGALRVHPDVSVRVSVPAEPEAAA